MRALHCSVLFECLVALLLGACWLTLDAPPAAAQPEDASRPRVIVLGFDGADPDVAQQMMLEGKLPNLARLAQNGSFGPLATTNPAESPVSWASFATSQGPGHHGIFDFLRRTRGTYFPEIALARAETAPGPSTVVRVGVACGVGVVALMIVLALLRLVRVPLVASVATATAIGIAAGVGGGMLVFRWIPDEIPLPVSNREGTAFWDHAARGGTRVTAIDIPVTFPALAEDGVKLTTALGTPDLRQTWGSWYLYSSASFDSDFSETAGTLKHVTMNGDRGVASMRGPRDFITEGTPEMSLDVEFTRLGDDAMRIVVQGQTVELAVGEWSDFVRVTFKLNPLVKLSGTTRFKLLDTQPDWHVYQEPLNFDPHHLPPTVNISFPRGFAGELADRYGLRETLGWSIATNPLKDEAIDHATFLEDLEFTLANRKRVVMGELERGDWDLFLAVFMYTDRMQHMMYRATDPLHPYFSEDLAAKYGDRIEWAYEEMDRIVGEVNDRFVDENTTLMIISDHGFHSFRRGVNLNTWLVENGMMTLQGQGLADADGNYQRLEDFLDPEGRFFKNVDWSKTQAYCMGLGSMFINLAGREPQGSVRPSEYDAVRDRIIAGLKALEDPEFPGQRVVVDVFKREDIFQGPQLLRAPDLFVGFESGYRVSWQTSAGGIPPQVIEDNLNNWSGDHCSVAPEITAGIFFSNRALPARPRSILDIGPTVLDTFGHPIPSELEGSSLLGPLPDAR